MLNVDHLLALVEPYRERRLVRGRKIALSTLSTLLFNDGKRLALMINEGGDIGSRKLTAAFQRFSDHWPAGAEWPNGIERPAPSPLIAATRADVCRDTHTQHGDAA